MTSMKINHMSQILGMKMDCRVLLPDELPTQGALKVLWLCHGGSGDENEWLYYSNIAELPDKLQLGIVIVNANDSCFVDMPFWKNYGEYIGQELPEILQNMFPVFSKKREDNYISGLSNGGYGCVIVGLKNRERFGAIGAFSAGDKADAKPKPFQKGEMNPRIRMFGQEDIHETEYSMKFLVRKVAGLDGPKPIIYHACGGLDPWLDLNLDFKQCVEQLGCEEYRYTYHQMEAYGHEWKLWEEEVRNFLEYVGFKIE